MPEPSRSPNPFGTPVTGTPAVASPMSEGTNDVTPSVARLADHDADPHARLFPDRPRVVKLSLSAGESVATHCHPGTDVLITVVEGELSVTIDEETYDLSAGELVRFSGDREVSPTAVEDATAVVSLSPQPG